MIILGYDTKIHNKVLDVWRSGESCVVIDRDAQDYGRLCDRVKAYEGIPSVITWTSGTAGEVKGVVIPWRAVEARCVALKAWWQPKDISRVTSFLPPNHSGGLITSRLSVEYAGGKFVELDDAVGATCVIGTPKRLRELVTDTLQKHPAMFATMRHSLRLLVANGSPLDEETRTLLESTGARVVDLYGTSETGGVAFDGEVLPGYEIRIEDGELLVRTDGSATGYLGADAPIRIREGWYATGDRAAITGGKLSMLIGKRPKPNS